MFPLSLFPFIVASCSFSETYKYLEFGCKIISRPAAANCGAKIQTYVSDKEHCTIKRPKES